MMSKSDSLILQYALSGDDSKTKEFFSKNMDLFVNDRDKFIEVFGGTEAWKEFLNIIFINKNKVDVANAIINECTPDLIGVMLGNMLNKENCCSEHSRKYKDIEITIKLELDR